MKKQFDVTGMTCAACSARVQSAVESLEGASDVQVNLLTNSMTVTFDEKQLGSSDIIMKVVAAGYGAEEHDPNKKKNDAAKEHEKKMFRRLIVSVILLVPLMYISMGHMVSLPLPPFLSGHENAHFFALSQLLITGVVLVINRKYFTGGFKALLKRSPNMDSLIAIGASAALVYGIVETVKIFIALSNGDMATVAELHQNLYFESAATIVTLVDIGKYLEERSKGKTKEVLDMLTELAPETAQVLRDGKEITVSSFELEEGDEIIVRPGTKLPADGIVVSGNGFVDQSALTGESMPVEKAAGDKVLCASVNTAGAFHFKATRVGNSTTLSQMIALSLEAAGSKAPISRLADKVSRIFVPVVISIAVLVFIVWFAVSGDVSFSLNFAISVLVISCPCALGLATPVAIMVGTGQGAKNGLLFKSAAAMEQLSSVDTVVFDKTGTLTKGEPAVTDVITMSDLTEDEIIGIAAELEESSEHPLARAIIQKAGAYQKKGISEFESFSGTGIKGKIGEDVFLIGNRKLMEKSEVACENQDERLSELASQGKTPLLFAKNKVLQGIIAVADVEKKNASLAVEALSKLNVDCVMLTGDNSLTANAVAKRLGINNTVSDVLPQNKDSVIKELREKGKTVAMVGDGINDAPALSRADVGIAIGDGTDIAIESADLVLLNKDIYSVVTAVKLSKKVIENIKMNLFWAFFYNSVSIPLAAGVFYVILNIKLTPMIAAGAMSLSSVCVVLNALRLRFFKADKLNDKTGKEEIEMKKIIEVTGMHCAHCAKSVENALLELDGVKKAKADNEKNEAVITFSGEVSDEAIKAAVEKAGFTCGKIEAKKGLFD